MNKEISPVAATTVTGRKVPCLEPKDQTGAYWQSAGQAWKVAFIVAPVDMQPSDLVEHPREAWAKLQQSGMGQLRLSQLDEVTVLCKDRSWMVEGCVHAADVNGVTFKPRSTSYLPQPAAEPKPTNTETKFAQTVVRG